MEAINRGKAIYKTNVKRKSTSSEPLLLWYCHKEEGGGLSCEGSEWCVLPANKRVVQGGQEGCSCGVSWCSKAFARRAGGALMEIILISFLWHPFSGGLSISHDAHAITAFVGHGVTLKAAAKTCFVGCQVSWSVAWFVLTGQTFVEAWGGGGDWMGENCKWVVQRSWGTGRNSSFCFLKRGQVPIWRNMENVMQILTRVLLGQDERVYLKEYVNIIAP